MKNLLVIVLVGISLISLEAQTRLNVIPKPQKWQPSGEHFDFSSVKLK
jgi:hypothetical protein